MNYYNDIEIIDLVKSALKEDIGMRDITTEFLIPKDKIIKAVLLAKENFVVCGLALAALVFQTHDQRIKFKAMGLDGQQVRKGKILAQITGPARSILTAERVALNFLCRLCGIANETRKFVDALKPYKAKIMDTRKTTPGLRLLEKYAVRIGGGFNHRLSLDEMVLIKDNHIKIIGGLDKLTGFSRKYKVEVEVKDLKEFKEILRLSPNIVMLDNMSLKDIRKAVRMRNSLSPNTHHLKPKLEASGRINLNNVKKIAASGVEMVSIGALTHSVTSVDISLEIL